MSTWSETYKCERMVIRNSVVEAWTARDDDSPAAGKLCIRVSLAGERASAEIALSPAEMRHLAAILQCAADRLETLDSLAQEPA